MKKTVISVLTAVTLSICGSGIASEADERELARAVIAYAMAADFCDVLYEKQEPKYFGYYAAGFVTEQYGYTILEEGIARGRSSLRIIKKAPQEQKGMLCSLSITEMRAGLDQLAGLDKDYQKSVRATALTAAAGYYMKAIAVAVQTGEAATTNQMRAALPENITTRLTQDEYIETAVIDDATGVLTLTASDELGGITFIVIPTIADGLLTWKLGGTCIEKKICKGLE